MKNLYKKIFINCVLFSLSIFCFLNIYGESDLYQETLVDGNRSTNGTCSLDNGKILLNNEQCILLTKLLDKGSYSVKITYSSDEEVNLNIYSIKYVDKENNAGKSFAYVNLTSIDNVKEFEINLDKKISDVGFYLNGTGTVEIKDIIISYNGIYYRDNQISLTLFSILMILIIAINFNQKLMDKLIKDNNFYYALGLALIFIIVNYPVLSNHSLHNPPYQDLGYHLNRIQGLSEAIQSENFPIRIHASEFGYYGQAESVFYPELFLMIPALLRTAKMSLMNSYRIFEILINGVTILVSYISFKNIFKSKRIGFIGSILYTFSIYRLTAFYVRAAVGEYCAMAFFPLLAWGCYELFFGDEQKWWIPSIAMTAILQAHLISTELSAGLCVFLGICLLPYLFKRIKRIKSIFKSVLFFILLNLWWFVPFLDFTIFGVGAFERNVGIQEPMIYDIRKLFAIVYPLGTGANMPFSIGILLVFGGIAYISFQMKKTFRKENFNKFALLLLGISVVLIWMATSYFPWNSSMAIFKKIGGTLQFSWRIIAIVTLLLTLILLLLLNYIIKSERKSAIITPLIFILSVIVALPILCGYKNIQIAASKKTLADIDSDGYTLDGWYLPSGTEIYYLYYEPGTIKSKESLDIDNFVRTGTNLQFDFTNNSSDNVIELPVLFYPGYEVRVNGEKIPIRSSRNKLIEFDMIESHGNVSVKYSGKILYDISTLVSGISLILFIYFIIKEKKYEMVKIN